MSFHVKINFQNSILHPILGCIRILWLVSHPLWLGLDKVLCGWNSVTLALYPLIVQPLAPYMVLVRHIFTTLQYTFKTLQELFRHNKHVLLLFY